jgi:hypothetical protein
MRLLIVLLLSISPIVSWGHEYFFAFAEMSYSTEESQYQGTLIVSTHDVEDWFRERGLDLNELEDHVYNEEMWSKMGELLFDGFRAEGNYPLTEVGPNEGSESLKFIIDGYEVLKNGMTNFYFHSRECEMHTSLDVYFGLMMEVFDQQQNKITFYDGAETFTRVFTQMQKRNKIELK